jgi:hypothetical protein
MALDSTFWIDAAGGPEWATDILASSGMYRPADRPAGAYAAPGVLTIVNAASPGDPRLIEAGLSARVCVFFANTDKTLTSQWTLSTVRTVMLFLNATEADAYFVYCSDSPALIRRNGEVVLDPRCGVWKPGIEPETLPLVTMAYRWREIPFS